MPYSLYIFFGILPSLIWLLLYLRQDAHPESNKMVLKVFAFGAIAVAPAILLEVGLAMILEGGSPIAAAFPFLSALLSAFIGVALVEEFLKYAVAKIKAFRSAECDEPIDVMLYMIIAALGFAALENILVLFSLGPEFIIKDAALLTILRFLGATFLHTLCSGIFGFFIALSFFEKRNRKKFFAIGLIIATLLHGLYNFSIIEMKGFLSFLIPLLILLFLTIFNLRGFEKLKKIKSVCRPKNIK